MTKQIGFSTKSKEETSSIEPPKTFERNGSGLLQDSSVEYVFTDDGMIDWRKMVKTEYLVSNRDRTSVTDVTKLQDRDLLILLGGIKELAQIRGYKNVSYTVTSPSSDYVVAVCTITWIPNYETENKEIVFSAIGDASPNNTKSFAKHFLGPIAENRAFVRCVRNFLRIHIVSQEEMGNTKLGNSSEEQEDAVNPRALLTKLMKEKNISFESVLQKLKKENYEDIDKISSIDKIPVSKCFQLIERIKKARKRKPSS